MGGGGESFMRWVGGDVGGAVPVRQWVEGLGGEGMSRVTKEPIVPE